jgi:hypothetical protein
MYISCIFVGYSIFFAAAHKVVKTVLTGFICLNVQLPGVFRASDSSPETDKRLLYSNRPLIVEVRVRWQASGGQSGAGTCFSRDT